MSFVKSVDRCDELVVGGWWRREESDLLGQRGQHPTSHSPSWRPHAGGLREKREGGRESSSVTRRHASWIQQAEQRCQGCLSKRDLAGAASTGKAGRG